MTDSYELLLILNLISLTAVCIHGLLQKKGAPKTDRPVHRHSFKKTVQQSEEEKRNAKILEDISRYNGTEVRK